MHAKGRLPAGARHDLMRAGSTRDAQMTLYEYRVVAAPRRAKRIRGMKASQDRFAATVSEVINDAAAEGWDYVRSETLPMEERQGMLKGRVEVLQSLLVFRRPLRGVQQEAQTREPSLRAPRPDAEDDGPVPVIRLGKPLPEDAE